MHQTGNPLNSTASSFTEAQQSVVIPTTKRLVLYHRENREANLFLRGKHTLLAKDSRKIVIPVPFSLLFLKHKQGGRFGQGFFLATQLLLEGFVLLPELFYLN